MTKSETGLYAEKIKEIPNFKSEEETREFWSENDSTEFVDWEKTDSVVLPKLKATTRKNKPSEWVN